MADDDDLSDLMGPEPEVTPIEGLIEDALGTDEEPLIEDVMGKRELYAGGRARLRASRSLGLRPPKHSHDRMIRVLSAAATIPIRGDICMLAGISYTTLKYWLQSSKDGVPGDKYDVYLIEDDDAPPQRFHDAYDEAEKIGVDRIERAAFQMSLGQREPLVFQGRQMFRHDPEMVALYGYECTQTYLLDKYGAPVPETIIKQDPDMIRFILKSRKPEIYGNKTTVDMNVRGGVLVVGEKESAKLITDQSDQSYKADAVDVEFTEVMDPEA